MSDFKIILSCYGLIRLMKASALLFHNLSREFYHHVTDFQKASILFLNLFRGLPLGRKFSVGLSIVTWDVHLLSAMRILRAVQVYLLDWIKSIMLQSSVLRLLMHRLLLKKAFVSDLEV